MMQRKKKAEHCQKGKNYINPVFTAVKTRSPQSFHYYNYIGITYRDYLTRRSHNACWFGIKYYGWKTHAGSRRKKSQQPQRALPLRGDARNGSPNERERILHIPLRSKQAETFPNHRLRGTGRGGRPSCSKHCNAYFIIYFFTLLLCTLCIGCLMCSLAHIKPI